MWDTNGLDTNLQELAVRENLSSGGIVTLFLCAHTDKYRSSALMVVQPPGQPIGVTVHCTQHSIREQPLSSQPSLKTQKIFHPDEAP
ncbi:hypothetical protein TNCV_2591661 [Trichonephila clavipes]|nr:hypothetical protein TNCV_2591661 [Trichonephila clavipes]